MLANEEKKKRENLINNATLFDMDKESSPSLYEAEVRKFVGELYVYYRECVSHKDIDGLVFTKTAQQCIKYYKREKGVFLHLFNRALGQALRRAKAKESIKEKRGGVKLVAEDEKRISKIIVYADRKGLDIYQESVQEDLAEALSMSVEKVRAVIMANDRAVAISSTGKNKDGEEVDLFDIYVSRDGSSEDGLVDRMDAQESFFALLAKMETVYGKLQERQKKLISMLLTVGVVKFCDGDLNRAMEMLTGKAYYNEEIFCRCQQNSELPTQKEIGELCGKAESDVSRVLTNLRKKMQ